jgi:DNA repair photolyase
MMVIRPFDPWGDKYCRCPKKLSLNPYTGCSHSCIYCYITSYIPDAFTCRPKENLIKNVEADLRKIDPELPISMCNSSDPYPHIERRLLLTRKCLQILREYGRKVLLITKSDLVTRDLDILEKMKVVVSFTITSLSPSIYTVLEPMAPPPEKRLRAISLLSSSGIPCTLRLDPLIPSVNEGEAEKIVRESVGRGVKHVTISTLKPRFDSFRRMKEKFPSIKNLRWERRKNAFYLGRRERERLLSIGKDACEKYGVSYGTCREGFPAGNCDGSYLLKMEMERKDL